MLSGDLTAGHEVVLLQKFVRLVVRAHKRRLVNQIPYLSGVHITRPFDVDGAANLVNAAVSSWVDFVNLLHQFLIDFEVLENGVKLICVPIIDVVLEHNLDVV